MLLDKISFAALFTSPTLTEYVYLGSSGVLGLVIGDYFGFHSMAILGARKSSIFTTLAPGSAFVFGYILLSENLGFIGIAGIVISIGGMIWFLAGSGNAEDKAIGIYEYGSLRKGIIYGVLSGLCQGFHLVMSKKGLMSSIPPISPVHATWIRVFAATIVYFSFTLVRGRLKKDVITPVLNKKHLIAKATYSTIFGLVLSILLVMWSVALCKVSVAQTILSLGPIVVVPIAYILYKERITYNNMLAAMVSVAGVVILIWREDILNWIQMYLH
jgi:drug/metabolite transporter (DMT)-like permease